MLVFRGDAGSSVNNDRADPFGGDTDRALDGDDDDDDGDTADGATYELGGNDVDGTYDANAPKSDNDSERFN